MKSKLFVSSIRHIAISTIDSAIGFDGICEFKSLVPTCMMKWSGLSLIDGFL